MQKRVSLGQSVYRFIASYLCFCNGFGFRRDFSAMLAEPVSHIYNRSVKDGHVPSSWKKANVVPVAKTRPVQSVESDLRPISLTPTICNVLESFCWQTVLAAIADKFGTKQFGSLRGRSILVHWSTYYMWHEALDKRQSVTAVFVDYAKAFDHADHAINFAQAAWHGSARICHPLDTLVSLWQAATCQDWWCLFWLVEAQKWNATGIGIGPYLFLVLINNLRTCVPVHKFVDDIMLSEVIGKQDASIMQSAIDELGAWSENNNMNVKKYKENQGDSSWSSSQVTSASICTQQQADRPRAFIQAARCCYKRLTDLGWPRCSNLFESQ